MKSNTHPSYGSGANIINSTNLYQQTEFKSVPIENLLNRLTYDASSGRFRYKGFTLGSGRMTNIVDEDDKRKKFAITILNEENLFNTYIDAFNYIDEKKDVLLSNIIKLYLENTLGLDVFNNFINNKIDMNTHVFENDLYDQPEYLRQNHTDFIGCNFDHIKTLVQVS